MPNVGNWTVEQCSTEGTTALTLIGTDLGYARWRDSLSAGEVYYSIQDGINREVGIGTFNGTNAITRDTITATLINNVYDDTTPTAISLSGSSIVSCSLNKHAYDDIVADIATNTANIATNTTNIATNITNISTNATNIATNTVDIATNAADIASLENTAPIFIDTSIAISQNGGALGSDDGTANYNVGIGHSAGGRITSGSHNNVMGVLGGQGITTGSYNISFGSSSMRSPGTGLTGNSNVAIGNEASYYLEEGDYNVAIGYKALVGDSGGTSGGNNIGIGYQTGFQGTTAANNIFIGYNAGYAATTTYSNVGIGYSSCGGAHNGSFTGGNNVSVGTYAGAYVTSGHGNVALGNYAGAYTNSGASIKLETLHQTICIGDYSYATASQEMSLGNSSYITAAYTAATFSQRSDERFKNFHGMDLGLSFINDLKPDSFTWKEGADKESINYGFSAQHVKATLEKHTDTKKRTMHKIRGNNPDDEQNLAYTEFIAPLVKAIQELTVINIDLINRIETLEKEDKQQ